jgi:hypothetical protein
MAVNARREVIDAVAAARYPTPTIDDLMALSALGSMGAHLEWPTPVISADDPFADQLRRSASRRVDRRSPVLDTMSGDGLVQTRAWHHPDYIAGFQRIGFHPFAT